MKHNYSHTQKYKKRKLMVFFIMVFLNMRFKKSFSEYGANMNTIVATLRDLKQSMERIEKSVNASETESKQIKAMLENVTQKLFNISALPAGNNQQRNTPNGNQFMSIPPITNTFTPTTSTTTTFTPTIPPAYNARMNNFKIENNHNQRNYQPVSSPLKPMMSSFSAPTREISTAYRPVKYIFKKIK